jgi:hypothetical protein
MLTMFKKIEKPAVCEMRSVIRFLNARNMKPADMHATHAMSDSMVRRWVRQFNEWREKMHDDSRSGRPSHVNEFLGCAVEVEIQENRLFTISSFSLHFLQISRSLLHESVSDKLRFRKLCSPWVPKLLTEEHKMKRQASAFDLFDTMLWCFMTMPAHTLWQHATSYSDIWLGTSRSAPLQPRIFANRFSCVPAYENFPWWPAVPRRQGQRSH